MSTEPRQPSPIPPLIARNLGITAITVVVCLAIGYGLGTLVALPFRPDTSTTVRARDGVSMRTEERFLPDSAFAQAWQIRRSVMWFCGLAGLLAAQSVFIVVHLRPAIGETR